MGHEEGLAERRNDNSHCAKWHKCIFNFSFSLFACSAHAWSFVICCSYAASSASRPSSRSKLNLKSSWIFTSLCSKEAFSSCNDATYKQPWFNKCPLHQVANNSDVMNIYAMPFTTRTLLAIIQLHSQHLVHQMSVQPQGLQVQSVYKFTCVNQVACDMCSPAYVSSYGHDEIGFSCMTGLQQHQISSFRNIVKSKNKTSAAANWSSALQSSSLYCITTPSTSLVLVFSHHQIWKKIKKEGKTSSPASQVLGLLLLACSAARLLSVPMHHSATFLVCSFPSTLRWTYRQEQKRHAIGMHSTSCFWLVMKSQHYEEYWLWTLSCQGLWHIFVVCILRMPLTL